MTRLPIIRLLLIILLSAFASTAVACPFCSAVSQTFSEEISTMDCVAIARLQKEAKMSNLNSNDAQAEVPKSRFEIVKVIKGKEFIKAGATFDTIYFGEAKKGRPFLAMATDAPNLMWSTPLILTDRAEAYLLKVSELSKDDERLEFFQDYLEDEDEMLARDAYDEFAKAPYKDVIALKPKMKREQLLKFIKDPEIPSNRRRLYFTMLGVCGTAEDAGLLEQLMASKERRDKSGLDAMLACYMILKGQDGLDRVDELFLKNSEAEYGDTYAAIMAIRFHGSETDVIPRKRLILSLRHMLKRSDLADLVIPDLARWEDWEVMPQLVELFVDADENSSWVRVPVINYLRACPDPIAKENIEELKKVDADAVKRAMTFFPLTAQKKEAGGDADGSEGKTVAPAAGPAVEESTDASAASSSEITSLIQSDLIDLPIGISAASNVVQQNGNVTLAVASEGEGEVAEAHTPVVASQSTDADLAATESAREATSEDKQLMPLKPNVNVQDTESAGNSGENPETLQEVEELAEGGANIWALLGVSFLGGGLCFVAMRSILGVG